MKPCKGETGFSVSSFQDSISYFSITQGSGCCAASTLGFAVPRFQRADSHLRLHPSESGSIADSDSIPDLDRICL
jgi:hypothetical protein